MSTSSYSRSLRSAAVFQAVIDQGGLIKNGGMGKEAKPREHNKKRNLCRVFNFDEHKLPIHTH